LRSAHEDRGAKGDGQPVAEQDNNGFDRTSAFLKVRLTVISASPDEVEATATPRHRGIRDDSSHGSTDLGAVPHLTG
jgi:hypothetical protein